MSKAMLGHQERSISSLTAGIKHSQAGMSLVEILVAVGIMSVIGLGMTTMSVTSMKASNRVEGNYNLSGLVHAIDTYAYNQNTCKSMLSGSINIDYSSLNADSKVPFELNLPGAGIVQSGATLDSYGLGVKAFELRNIQKVGVDLSGNSFVVGTLFLGAEILKSTSGGQDFKERAANALHLKISSAGVVVDCAGYSIAGQLIGQNPGGGTPGGGSYPSGPGAGGPGGGSYPGGPGAGGPGGGGSFPGGGGTGGGISDETTLPNGQTVGSLTTSTCDAVCVVQKFFQQNSTGTNPIAEANNWMNTVGASSYTTYANAYSMNQNLGVGGVAQNAVSTGNALGYSQNAVDDWTIATYNQYNNLSTPASNYGADLYQSTVTGYNTASAMYDQATVQNYISTYGVEQANAAALIVQSAAGNNMNVDQTSAAINQATSMYSADVIASYFASGGTVAAACAAGYITDGCQ